MNTGTEITINAAQSLQNETAATLTANINTIGTNSISIATSSSTIATATVQNEQNQKNILIDYGIDFFLVICFIIVYFIKPDPELSLEKQREKEKAEGEPNELEKILVTEPEEDDETTEINKNQEEKK